jgi:hypothetical protein
VYRVLEVLRGGGSSDTSPWGRQEDTRDSVEVKAHTRGGGT